MNTLIERLAYPDRGLDTLHRQVSGWLVAYSGGLDSRVLLDLVAKAHELSDIPVQVVHINHGVNPKAKEWEEHCVSVANSLQLPIKVIRLSSDQNSVDHSNLEARLRKLRYEALSECLKDNWCLLLAHHANDQAETVLLQLLRGAGVRGLAGMPNRIEKWQKGFRWRPLLSFSKEELRVWAIDRCFAWIEDDSNEDTRYRRNFIRHQIIPKLTSNFAATTSNFNRTAKLMAESSELLDELAQLDWQTTQGSSAPYPENIVKWPSLNQLSEARRRNLWRYIFHKLGYSMPSVMQLELLHKELIMARSDAMPILRWPELTLRRYRDKIYILPKGARFSAPFYNNSSQNWQIEFPSGRICLVSYKGDGLSKATESLNWRTISTVGEKIYVMEQSGERKVRKWSKLAQNISIPSWWRGEIPLLFAGDYLVVVPGFWTCGDWSYQWR